MHPRVGLQPPEPGEVPRRGYAQTKQRRLSDELGRRELIAHDSVTVVASGLITPNGKDHFAIFTPYLRHWKKQPTRTSLPPPTALTLPPRVHRGTVPRQADICVGPLSPDLPPGGERQARRRMHAWLDEGVQRYSELHDDLAADYPDPIVNLREAAEQFRQTRAR